MAKKKTESFQYYNIKNIVKKYPSAYYYVIYGERSNGKTYSALNMALENYFKTGEQFAYVRRFGEDIRKKQLSNLFSAHINNEVVVKLSKYEWTGITYQGNKFFLTRLDEKEKVEVSGEPVGFAFDLNSMEHYKSISFPNVTSIIYDEFLSRSGYLPNEFLLFTNTISTIVRLRTNVKIYMLGNTVNKYCPYFSEMGLTHIKDQKQGTIDVYKYGESDLEVAVEYCSSSSTRGGKASDVYFAFDNPQLQMITTGAWEIPMYPHLTEDLRYKPKEVAGQFFVDFDHEILHGVIVAKSNKLPFVFLHRKTTDIKKDTDFVYGQMPDASPFRRIGISNYKDKLTAFIRQCVIENRVFYSENEVGEIWRNYIIWADNERLRNK